MPPSSEALARAIQSLEGLSVGDAFGQCYIGTQRHVVVEYLLGKGRRLLPSPWPWTDDTEMALSIVEQLATEGHIDQDRLAARFAARFDPHRGYAGGAIGLLEKLKQGGAWGPAARAMFNGSGSFGNGSAMRVAPLGAYFADDLPRAAEQGRLSAEVTHAHPEGLAGGSSVAVAAALAWRSRGQAFDAAAFFRAVIDHTPKGYTRDGILEAAGLPADTDVLRAAEKLGNGSGVSVPDTVPFALWAVTRRFDDYEEAMWLTVSALGDCDTTCAIAGGVVTARLGAGAIPFAWRRAREPLPQLEGVSAD